VDEVERDRGRAGGRLGVEVQLDREGPALEKVSVWGVGGGGGSLPVPLVQALAERA
jgi:hypothetical protein